MTLDAHPLGRRQAPIAVCIGTYGDQDKWAPLAYRAMASIDRQTVAPCWYTWHHSTTLHDARNSAARTPYRPDWYIERGGLDAEWLCFLDADDELDPGYIEAMAAAVANLEGDWLLQPATLGVYPDGHEDAAPALIPARPLQQANYLVIGTLVRADQFRRVGGFRDLDALEDWDLWRRCATDGAQVTSVPDAIYRVYVNDTGRNAKVGNR